jgi:enediyne biosynthesis protein CalE5
MDTAQTFDPVEFKNGMRAEWGTAAAGWRAWTEMMEAEHAGRAISEKLIELAGLVRGDVVLDVAAGYGEPGLTAARTVAPGGRVVCADLSGEMLAYAAERAAKAGVENIELVEDDAEELAFEEASFDAVLSRAGLMYLPDVAGTLRRLHAFLKPGGRLAASVWGPPETVQFATPVPVIMEALELPPPPADQPGIFALSEPSVLAHLVSDAGFADVATGSTRVVYEASTADDLTRWIREVAPPISELVDGQPADVQERVWRKVTEAWEPFATPAGTYRTENQAIWVAGTRN